LIRNAPPVLAIELGTHLPNQCIQAQCFLEKAAFAPSSFGVFHDLYPCVTALLLICSKLAPTFCEILTWNDVSGRVRSPWRSCLVDGPTGNCVFRRAPRMLSRSPLLGSLEHPRPSGGKVAMHAIVCRSFFLSPSILGNDNVLYHSLFGLASQRVNRDHRNQPIGTHVRSTGRSVRKAQDERSTAPDRREKTARRDWECRLAEFLDRRRKCAR
jgi:hypothetical protein